MRRFLLLLVMACGYQAPPSVRPSVPLTVVNRGWSDVTVWISDGLQPVRVGDVRAQGNQILWIRPDRLHSDVGVRIGVHAIAGGWYWSDPLSTAGRLEVWVEQQLGSSSAMSF